MTTEKPPREWWINFRVGASSYAHMTLKAATQFKAFPGIEIVHVIEYSADEAVIDKYTKQVDKYVAQVDELIGLREKLAIAKSTLEEIEKIGPSYGLSVIPEIAHKALEEIK